jgi:GT2 family glycosyltransferase
VYHKVSKTIGLFSKEYLYYVARNWLIVARKAGFKMYIYALITEPLRIMYYFLKLKEKWKIVYYLKGLKDGILGVRGKTL